MLCVLFIATRMRALQITNNEAEVETAEYEITITGLDADVLAAPLVLGPEETRTMPLVVRIPEAEATARTIPFQVIIRSPTAQLQIPTTFKTGVGVGEES